MKKIILVLFVLFSLLSITNGQVSGNQANVAPSPSYNIPDCQLPFTLNTTAASQWIDNRTTGCTSWDVFYFGNSVTGFSGTAQFAPDSNGTPGAASNWPAGSVIGAFPLTVTSESQISFSGFHPWVRFNVTTLTGAGAIVTGKILGWRVQGSAEATAASAPIQGPIPVGSTDASTTNPVQVGGIDSSNNVQKVHIGATLGVTVEGVKAVGANGFTLSNPLPTGCFGGNTANSGKGGFVQCDSNGNLTIAGTAATGSTLAGSPVRIGISDGTSAQDVRQGPSAQTGAAPVGLLGIAGSTVTYTPAQFGVNALSYGSGGTSAASTTIDLRGATAFTLSFQSTSVTTLNEQVFAEDGTTILVTLSAATSCAAATQALFNQPEAGNAATVQNTCTIGTSAKFPLRAVAFTWTNTNATAGTVTGRIFVKY